MASAMLSNVMFSIAIVTKVGHRFALQHIVGQRSYGMHCIQVLKGMAAGV